VQDSEFPLAAFHKLGYTHVAINGQKGYHGVAIVSKIPLQIIDRRSFCEKGMPAISLWHCPRRRARQAITLHNFYVPAGGDEPDPAINPKFAHKLAFLDEMTHWTNAKDRGDRRNSGWRSHIAPLETDVWNHKALLRVVSHTPIEVEKLNLLRDAGPWIDVLRHFVGAEERLYTWWSYRAGLGEVRQRAALTMFGSAKALSRVSTAPGFFARAAAGSAFRHVPVMVDFRL